MKDLDENKIDRARVRIMRNDANEGPAATGTEINSSDPLARAVWSRDDCRRTPSSSILQQARATRYD